jgi:staphylococcal nuclease domain-containing protein 1
MFIGIVLHPNGNIAEHLVANGLARVVDWHAGMLSTVGGMERLRSAEAYVYTKSIWNNAADGRSSQGSQGKETVFVRAFRFWYCHTIWDTIQWCCCIWGQAIV